MVALAVSIITFILSLLVGLILPFAVGMFSDFFYTGTAFEAIYGSDLGINLTSTYNIIYKYAIAILVVFFIKKLIETYFSWSAGDPDTSPFAILVNFLKAMIVMIFFGYLYRLFIRVMYDMYAAIVSNGLGLNFDYNTTNLTLANFNVIGWIFSLIIEIYLLLIWFQNLNRGLQTLILRIGIPFAAIGLLNSDGGAFKGYSKKLIQNIFSVIIQLILTQIALNSWYSGWLLVGLAFASAALKTPSMLNEFLISSGSNSERGLGAGIGGATSTLSHAAGLIAKR